MSEKPRRDGEAIRKRRMQSPVDRETAVVTLCDELVEQITKGVTPVAAYRSIMKSGLPTRDQEKCFLFLDGFVRGMEAGK